MCSGGYKLERTDRNRRGGGVAVLFKDSLTHENITETQYDTFEYVHVLLSSTQDSAHIVCIYRPLQSPTQAFLQDFTQLVEMLHSLNQPVFIAGDFNIHVDIKTDPLAVQFLEILDVFCMQQHIKEPTHVQGHTLDLLITRDDDSLLPTNSHVSDLITDHNAVVCTIKLRHRTANSSVIQYRRIKDMDIDKLRDDIKTLHYSMT